MKKYILPAAAGLIIPLGTVASHASQKQVEFSQEQAAAGAVVYASRCAVCHSDNLEGGDVAPSLKGKAFWHVWSAQPIHQLYSRIVSTMPLDEPGVLTEEETMSLVAFIASVNGVASSGKAGASNAASLMDAFFMSGASSMSKAVDSTESPN